jgi:hypothetical protein
VDFLLVVWGFSVEITRRGTAVGLLWGNRGFEGLLLVVFRGDFKV